MQKEPKDRYQIIDVEDNLDRITMKVKCTCFHCGHMTVSSVEIYRPHYDDSDGRKVMWSVIYDGALDYDGNKKDLLKRYPEFKGITVDLK